LTDTTAIKTQPDTLINFKNMSHYSLHKKSSKSDLMHAVMGNPKTARVLKAAFEAPVGSTERLRARKMLGTINRIHLDPASAQADGQGGPGMMMLRQEISNSKPEPKPKKTPENDPVHIPTDGSKGLVYFHTIPKPSITYGPKKTNATATMWKPKAGSFDGQGGPGYDGQGGPFDNNGGFSLSDLPSALGETFGTGVGNIIKGGIGATLGLGARTARNIADVPTEFFKGVYQGGGDQTPQGYDPTKAATPVGTLSGELGQAVGMGVKPLVGAVGGITSGISQGLTDAFAGDAMKKALYEGYNPGQTYVPAPVSGPTSAPVVSPKTTTPAKDTKVSATPKVEDPAKTTSPVTGKATSTIDPNHWKNLITGTGTGTIGTGTDTTGTGTGTGTTGTGTTGTGTGTGTGTDTTGTGTGTGTQPPQVAGWTTDQYAAALVPGESGTKGYGAIGQTMQTGENAGYAALGKYQIMPNIWFSSIGLNPDSLPDQQKFVSSPQLQDQLFSKIIGGLQKQYGNDPTKVIAAYFGGGKGAQNVGTAAGDVQSDGHTTVNQYVQVALERGGGAIGTGTTAGGTGTTTGGTGDTSLEAALSANLGPKTFALNTLASQGMDLATQQAQLDLKLRQNYNLDALQKANTDANSAVIQTPKDLQDYLRQQDTNLSTLDQQKADFVNTLKSVDMGDPTVRAEADNYLKFLDTERGKISARYATYVSNAVTDLTNKADIAKTNYQNALDGYKADLASDTGILKDEYTQKAEALADMYTSAQNAPKDEIALAQAKVNLSKTMQELAKLGTTVADTEDFNKVKKSLEDYNLLDTKDILMPGNNLVNSYNNLAAGPNATMDPEVFWKVYGTAFQQNMAITSNTADPVKNKNNELVDASYKNKLFKAGLEDMGIFEREYSANGVPASLLSALRNTEQDVLSSYTTQLIGEKANDASVVSDWNSAADSLVVKHWFGRAATPVSKEQFLAATSNLKNISPTMASWMYDQFKTATTVDGQTPEQYIADQKAGTPIQIVSKWAPVYVKEMSDQYMLPKATPLTTTQQ
jgi:hypothetical protein